MEVKEFNAFIDLGYDGIVRYVNDEGLREYYCALHQGKYGYSKPTDRMTRSMILREIRSLLEEGEGRKITLKTLEKHAHLPKGMARNSVRVYYNGKLTTWGKLRPMTKFERMNARLYDWWQEHKKGCNISFRKKKVNEKEKKIVDDIASSLMRHYF